MKTVEISFKDGDDCDIEIATVSKDGAVFASTKWELAKKVGERGKITTLHTLDEQNVLLAVPTWLTRPRPGRGADGKTA